MKTSLKSKDFDILEKENIRRMSPGHVTETADQLLSAYSEIKILDMVRKLGRNNSQVKGWLKQIFLNTIGTGQKPKFNSNNKEWSRKAASLYKKRSRNWEGRDNKTRYESNRQVLLTAFREGEVFCFYDSSGIIRKDYWFYWTREYMPGINDSDFRKHKEAIAALLIPQNLNESEKDYQQRLKQQDIRQVKGLIVNRFNITLGYIIGTDPGKLNVKYDPDNPEKSKATILPHTRFTKLFKISDEINSKHGFSEFLALASEVNDVKRLIKAHIRKAENQARMVGAFKVKNPLKKQHSRAVAEKLGDTEPARNEVSAPLENFEKLAKELDVYIEYMERDEEFEFKSLSTGESHEIENTYNNVTCQGGFGLGLPRVYSTGSSDKSSFAGLMAEFNVGRCYFNYLQKFIERELYDFEVNAVITGAIEDGLLEDQEDWQDSVSWSGFPKVKSLNPLQDIKALKEWLKAGLMPPEDITDDPEAALKSLSELKKRAEALGLNLDIFSIKESINTDNSNNQGEEENVRSDDNASPVV